MNGKLIFLFTNVIYCRTLICLAASYSCGENFSTTISAEELNFCVRYGNRCDLLAIATRHVKVLGRTFVILFSDKIYYISFMRKRSEERRVGKVMRYW